MNRTLIPPIVLTISLFFFPARSVGEDVSVVEKIQTYIRPCIDNPDNAEVCLKSTQKTISVFGQQCVAGDGEACTFLGMSLNKLKYENKNEVRGYLERGCELENGIGCSVLATMWNEGFGGPRDTQKARANAKKSCDLGYGYGCDLLGFYVRTGVGGAVDLKAARVHCATGCKLESGSACYSLGMMIRRGDGGNKDLFEAHGYFQKACDLGDQNGCTRISEYTRTTVILVSVLFLLMGFISIGFYFYLKRS
ncbi:MAG: sel1 repeat family protein [Deltaproteobacteria bacterium]|nr:sel1 repeat family protein [Deltaproteobacteria bacterium]